MATSFYIGIEGGGTKSSAVMISNAGEILKRETAGPLNFQVLKSSLYCERLVKICESLITECDIRENSIRAVTVASAGISGELEKQKISTFWKNGKYSFPVFPVNDIEAAHYAFFSGGPGVLLNAGTGSIALAKNSRGEMVRCGGRGYIVGDEGSGFAIGRDALSKVFRAYDGMGSCSGLTEIVLKHYSCKYLEDIISKVYSSGPVSANVASIAPEIFYHAENGNEDAESIVNKAINELNDLLESSISKSGKKKSPVFIGLSGGLFSENSYFYKKFVAIIKKSYTINKQQIDIDVSAALIGMINSGLCISGTGMKKLKRSYKNFSRVL